MASHDFVPGAGQRRKLTALALSCAVLPALVFFAGCGGDKRIAVHPVTGKVTHKETPAGAQIVLHAVNKEAAPGALPVTPTGVVKPDGTFALTSYEPGDGAPAGDYVVTIEWFKPVTDQGGSGRGPNVLPAKYAARDKSPLKVTVSSSGPNSLPIEISDK